jgi:hypothetical protein
MAAAGTDTVAVSMMMTAFTMMMAYVRISIICTTAGYRAAARQYGCRASAAQGGLNDMRSGDLLSSAADAPQRSVSRRLLRSSPD